MAYEQESPPLDVEFQRLFPASRGSPHSRRHRANPRVGEALDRRSTYLVAGPRKPVRRPQRVCPWLHGSVYLFGMSICIMPYCSKGFVWSAMNACSKWEGPPVSASQVFPDGLLPL